MKNRKTRRVTARYKWDRLKVSFWFAPVIMSLGAILLTWAMHWLDLRIPNQILQERHLILSGSPSELRTLLIGMASTTLATAGVVFTLFTLPLSTVAAQYGSRLLRIFLGDRTTQLVLGMFVATFVYCLVAALFIPPDTIEPQGYQLTATAGLVLMLGTFSSLILLIQHISTMLQAPNIAAVAGAELREVVRSEVPEEIRSSDNREDGLETLIDSLVEADGHAVRVIKTGYIQYIDPQALIILAREHNLVIRLLCKPGNIVFRDTRVALVWPNAQVDQELDRQIRNAFRIGNLRTPTQDVIYAVNQLVEIAVRAMSPAINDPFTAMTCLDYVGEGLALFIQQGEKRPYYFDQNNQLRLILEPVTFPELVSAAFDMLRHCSCDNSSVLLHMLDVIDTIGREASSPTISNTVEVRQELLRQVNLIKWESQAGAIIDQDRERISRRCIELTDFLQT